MSKHYRNKDLITQMNKRLLEQGIVLVNNGVPEKTLYFKYLGNYYTTNQNRTKRYSLDNPLWHSDRDKTFFWKTLQVLTKKAHKVH